MKLKHILLGIAGLTILIVLGKMFGRDYIPPKKEAKKIEVQSVLNKRNWKYTNEEDKMTSDTTHTAYVEANEELNFAFPYNGGSKVTLMIRKKSNDTNVILSVNKGQFIPKISGGSVLVRFGKDPAKKYPTAMSSDYSSDVLFINNEKEFVNKLKSHETVIIEAEFYHEGLEQIEFNIANLEWDH